MAKVFHIVNGDTVVPLLEQSGIEGKIIVWREMLCDGPLDIEVGSDNFWIKRYNFFQTEFRIQKLEYFDKTIKEILKAEDLPVGAEVVMWFEYDLFCQVNLMALCSFLFQSFRKDITYYLVCTGKVKGKEKLQTLSDFTPAAFKNLYEHKIKITRDNLLYAENCWKVFVENDPYKIADFNFGKKGKFQYFQLAMNQHLKRFPSENGLNEIQIKILKIINLEAFSDGEIVNQLLIWQQQHTVYGFGDMQYFLYLKKLSDYYTIINKKYYLNEAGKAIVNQ